MAVKDRAFQMVKETISAGGTGVVTLGGAVLGYDTFTSRLADGDNCYVMFSLEDGNFTGGVNDWEISRCTFTATGTTLTRDVIQSSNADAAITVSTSHVAFICLSAETMDNIAIFSPTGFGAADKNVYIGKGAGNSTTTAIDNTIVGGGAGNALTTGQENTFVGKDAGILVTTGDLNTFVGKDAGNKMTGSKNTVIGKDAGGGSGSNTGSQNVYIGAFNTDAGATGSENVSIGEGTTTAGVAGAGRRNSIIGAAVQTSSGVDYNYILGYRCTGAFDAGLAFGYRITTTAARQCVFGNAAYATEGAITDFYFNGITHSSGTAPTLQACGGSGTDNVGKAINLAGGKSTGNAAGGAINFQTSDAGASGTTLQSLTTKGYVDGTDGGLVWGSPTGGSQGAGTINAVAVYDDSTILTDYIFEIYYDGQPVDQQHTNYTIKSLDDEIQYVKDNKHLSTISGRSDWEKGRISTGKLISELWATVETQHLYITEARARELDLVAKLADLEARLKALEVI